MPGFTFKKSERLSSRKAITALFLSGRALYVSPLKILFHLSEKQAFPVSVAISVPKKIFKKAVDRNLLKRRIREAYRLNKNDLYLKLNERNKKISLIILYQHTDIKDYHSIEEALIQALGKLILQIH